MSAERESLEAGSPFCSKCGHPESEHRAEVLPFATCHNSDSRDLAVVGLSPIAYGVTPCWCSSYEGAE